MFWLICMTVCLSTHFHSLYNRTCVVAVEVGSCSPAPLCVVDDDTALEATFQTPGKSAAVALPPTASAVPSAALAPAASSHTALSPPKPDRSPSDRKQPPASAASKAPVPTPTQPRITTVMVAPVQAPSCEAGLNVECAESEQADGMEGQVRGGSGSGSGSGSADAGFGHSHHRRNSPSKAAVPNPASAAPAPPTAGASPPAAAAAATAPASAKHPAPSPVPSAAAPSSAATATATAAASTAATAALTSALTTALTTALSASAAAASALPALPLLLPASLRSVKAAHALALRLHHEFVPSAHGLPRAIFDSLTRYPFPQPSVGAVFTCTICSHPLQSNQEVMALPCTHKVGSTTGCLDRPCV
jgi:hypothetical protein